MGLGHRRRYAGACVAQALWLGHRSERAHSPIGAEGGGQHDLPHRVVDGVSAACPGSAPSPGPMLVPADKLRTLLGLSTVTVVQGHKRLAIIDKKLDAQLRIV